ncbi:beta-ketoacyl synthase N-terminal-like domain-containing protein [Polluticaenibacter yanchengensis]|uniref:Beta-ketoacyl synthase N-terminal-like domain-containing protein n=1 Tax=Polluticaenibacter yanchengensis TaxID=3014562 RepID=A0ABT4UMW0_9BACT|nr:beta-ketoacyl synthase N-terminal-like domain-containing protein [Chitinophagaceae bacterium LY-5]
MKNSSVYINDYNCITPLGFDVQHNMQHIRMGNTAIKPVVKDFAPATPLYLGEIGDNELNRESERLAGIETFTRLERLMILCLEPIIDKERLGARTGLIVSTTKGNIRALESIDVTPEAVELAKLAKRVAGYFGIVTEPIVVSNACVSGILSIAVAKRYIQMGIFDEVYVIAGDEVSEFVISGFNAFQAMDAKVCQPYDKDRNGINLGEAVAAVKLSEMPGWFKVIGDGAINDANHISGPSRTGEGLYRSLVSAFKEASVNVEDIGFISAHGTATVFNDEMEAIAFNRMGLQNIPVHSLKAYYGHTLGASGLLETVIAMQAVKENKTIISKGFETTGTSLPINISIEEEAKDIRYFVKTASGFGGCNTAVIFEKVK